MKRKKEFLLAGFAIVALATGGFLHMRMTTDQPQLSQVQIDTLESLSQNEGSFLDCQGCSSNYHGAICCTIIFKKDGQSFSYDLFSPSREDDV